MEEEQKDAILIEFEDKDSSLFDIKQYGRVNPFQLLAVGNYLEVMAKQMIVRSAEQQAQVAVPERKIEVAKPF